MEKLHGISRGASEEYVVFFTEFDDAPIQVFDLKTNSFVPISYGNIYSNGVFSRSHTVKKYFQGLSDARKEIKCLTVHDTTFVVNKNKTPAMTNDVSPDIDEGEVFIVVDNWYEKSFDITAGTKTVTVSPTDGYNATIDDVAELIKETLQNTDWENEVSFKYTGNYSGVWNTRNNKYARTYTANLVGTTDWTAELTINSDDTFTFKSLSPTGTVKDTITGTVTADNELQSSWKSFVGDLRSNDSGDYWNIIYYDSDGYVRRATFMVPQSDFAFNINVTSAGEITGLLNSSWNVDGRVTTSGQVDMISINAPETYIFTGQINTDFKITGIWYMQNGHAPGVWSGVRTSSPATSVIFTAERKGAVVRAKYTSTALGTSLPLHNGFLKVTGRGIKVRAGSVPTFQDLWPASYWADVKLRIQQSNYSQVEGYYVYSDGTTWEESTGYNIKTTLDPATMPHKIVRWYDGSFKVAPCLWEDRLIGDDDSAPIPSFIGQPINNLFFQQDRLSFITDNTIIMSRSGDYFNFFPKTALEILDDDPIDIGIGSIKSSRLLEALPFNKQIILRGETSQHLLSFSGSYLSPATTALDITTMYRTYSDSISASVGSNLYFLTPVKGYTQVMEYFIQPETYLEDAADITKQIPKYIKADADKFCKVLSCPEKDMLFVFTNLGETSEFYVYNYLWQGGQKPVSSWNTWKLSGKIIDAEVVGTNLYLLVNDGITRFLKLSLDTDSLNYLDLPFRLDYVAPTVYLPYIPKTDLEVYLMKATGEFKKVSQMSLVDDILTIEEDLEDYEYIIGGLSNSAFIKLSGWYLKDQNNNPVMNSLQLTKTIVTLEPTTYKFNEQVKQHKSSDTEVTDSFVTLVRDAHNTNIIISSVGGNPMNIKTVTYEGYTSKSRLLR
jgi:hypothetical protein